MVLAAGGWAWWNGFGTLPIASCVQRAKEAALHGIIVKWGHWEAWEAFQRAGVPLAVERYVYPHQAALEARRLAEGIDRGGRFAVINAEIEWESLGPEPMRQLIAEFRRHQPTAELYASVDTRGGRMALPYQRVLAEHAAGWMPMVYPKAFRPSRPAGYVAQAFRDCLDGKDFGGKPVLPTIQTYDQIGAAAVRAQLAEVRRRGLRGYQAYTIAHATDGEWAEVTREEEDDVAAIDELKKLQTVAGIFLQAASHALRGERLSEGLKAQIRFLLG